MLLVLIQEPSWQIYIYDHPAGDKEVGGGERRPEEGSHHEEKNTAEHKIVNRFEIKSFNGIKVWFEAYVNRSGIVK